MDINKLTEFAKGLDLKELQDIKNSMDREKVVESALGMIENLKGSMPEQEQQAVNRFIEALMKK
ncbi:MAG: hypothetical protein ACM3KR_04790 [Deltaproteobacteria bacterium]